MKYIYNTLYSLGLHLGGYYFLTKTENYKFLIGYRNNISIIDINLLLFQIKKSVLFLNEIGKLNGFLLFYCYNISKHSYYLKLFLLNIIYYNFNQAFLDKQWSYGQLSNSFTQIRRLLTSLFYLDAKTKTRYTKKNKIIKNTNKLITHVRYDVCVLLYRILFFSINKRLKGMTWEETLNSVKDYWRFFNFFKYYSFLKNHPDCFICLNDSNILNPLFEAQYLNIPTVFVASDMINTNISSYLIVSNSKSNIISIFYVILFLFSYQAGIFTKYKSIIL
jgi:ribosomal protein S2